MSEFDLASVNSMQKRSPFHLPRQPATTQDLQILSSVGRYYSRNISEEKSLEAAQKFAEWANSGAERTNEEQKAILKTLRENTAIPLSTASKKTDIWPIVPMVTSLMQIGCFTRNTGKPWNPGGFVKGMINKGASSEKEATRLAKDLKQKLGIEKSEDIWAAELEKHMKSMAPLWGNPDTTIENESEDFKLPHEIRCRTFPARALTEDLPHILKIKKSLTRRQWISMLDSLLRISCATELLWVARANSEVSRMIIAATDMNSNIPSEDEIGENLVGDGYYLTSDLPFDPQAQSQIRDYAHARIFIREILNFLENKKASDYEAIEKDGGLCTHRGILRLIQVARRCKTEVLSIRRNVSGSIDSKPDFLNLKKAFNWPSQCWFFIDGVLRQRRPGEAEKRHFDQGYWCVKSGSAKSARWVFRPGPIGILIMAQLAGARSGGSATANGMVRQFSRYGIRVSLDEVTQGQIGQDLRHLGLVIDSPDAEGGMLIRNPFES